MSNKRNKNNKGMFLIIPFIFNLIRNNGIQIINLFNDDIFIDKNNKKGIS